MLILHTICFVFLVFVYVCAQVFGKVVGGLDTLFEMEKVKTADKDRPISDIVINNITIFVDPYMDVISAEEERKAAAAAEEERLRKEKEAEVRQRTVHRAGVGKYISTFDVGEFVFLSLFD